MKNFETCDVNVHLSVVKSSLSPRKTVFFFSFHPAKKEHPLVHVCVYVIKCVLCLVLDTVIAFNCHRLLMLTHGLAGSCSELYRHPYTYYYMSSLNITVFHCLLFLCRVIKTLILLFFKFELINFLSSEIDRFHFGTNGTKKCGRRKL